MSKPTTKTLVQDNIEALRALAAGKPSYEVYRDADKTFVDCTAIVADAPDNRAFYAALAAAGFPSQTQPGYLGATPMEVPPLTQSFNTLLDWAKHHGLDSRAGFSAFKKALLAEGIDYDALRAEKRVARAAETEAKATASLILFADAKARTQRFAICNAKGEPVWYGRFFDDDRDFNGEQSSGEMAAAKKAVWFASKIKDTIGAEAIRLTLKIDAEWLTWANEVGSPTDDGKRGGKARSLGEMAQRFGVVLTVEHIAGVSNPADQYTVAHGFKKWQDNDLTALVING